MKPQMFTSLERRSFVLIRKINFKSFWVYRVGKRFLENLLRNENLRQIKYLQFSKICREFKITVIILLLSPWVLSALLRSKLLVPLLVAVFSGHFMTVATRYSFWEFSGKQKSISTQKLRCIYWLTITYLWTKYEDTPFSPSCATSHSVTP